MLVKIGRDYGKLNWATAANTTHIQECAAVLRTAVASADFIVFKQSSGHWAVKRLAWQNVKFEGRSDTIADVEVTEPERKKARSEDETTPIAKPPTSPALVAAAAAGVIAAMGYVRAEAAVIAVVFWVVFVAVAVAVALFVALVVDEYRLPLQLPLELVSVSLRFLRQSFHVSKFQTQRWAQHKVASERNC